MNRKILSAAILQHSSKVQPFKQSSLDRIVERILFFADNNCLTEDEIQNEFLETIGYSIPLSVFEHATKRLLKQQSIEHCSNDEERFLLKKQRKSELQLIESNATKRQENTIQKIFNNAPDKKRDYNEPFWFSLSYIFSNIGEYSAKLVNGTVDKETILLPILDNCMREVEQKFTINISYFLKRIIYFFSELNEPVFNETKCILSQNYFISKSIGINPDSETFSKELFEDNIFYLDTNVLLAIISENNRKHNNAISFINAAKKIGLQFKIANITIHEYETWVESEIERIRKTVNQIPKETKSKVASPVYQDYYQKYLEKYNSNEDIDRDNLLTEIEQTYFNYKEIFENLIGEEKIEYVDDAWFDTIENEKGFDDVVKLVKEKYSEVSVRIKGPKAAIHDAKILLWIEKEAKGNQNSFLFVSTDTSLPLIKFDANEKSNNINLEAVLQWILPLTNNSVENDTNHVIAEFLKQRLLPKEFMFEIKDFIIFDQLQMECRELPHEDVENCILYLKNNKSDLDPNKALDREKFASEIAKYFLDPSRKYQQELSKKETENLELQQQLGEVFSYIEELKESSKLKDNQLEQTKLSYEEELSKIKEKNDEKIKGFEKVLSGVSSELEQLKEEKRQDKISLKMKAWKKSAKYALALFVTLVLFGILELLPDWGWNYPAKLLSYFNSIEATAKGTFNICIGLNIFLLSGLIITLFIFIYNRLLNKDNMERKLEFFEERFK